MSPELGTTNLMLGIIAAVSVLEALLVIGLGVGAFMAYRRAATVFARASALLAEVEQRHVAPVMLRVNTILDDVKDVTATVKDETNRVDSAIRTTMARVDDTADRVRSNVRAKTSLVVGFVRGVRVALDTMLKSAA